METGLSVPFPFLDFAIKAPSFEEIMKPLGKPRVLVFGSREWPDSTMVRRDMWKLHQIIGKYIVVNGYCEDSPDMIADSFAPIVSDDPPERHPADWKKYGRRAGPIRNKEMADTYPDYAMGYILNESNGSMNMREHLALNHISTRITAMNIGGFAGFPEI